MDRNRLQEIAAHLLAKETRLLCTWATGVGKSNVAIKFLQANPDFDCLILVPEQNNIENWEKEFDKFGVSREKVTIACYASFKKYVNTQWYLIVLDEVPHIDTELRREVCKSVKGDFILALGAVVDLEELFSLEDAYGKFYKSEITLAKAIEKGLLPRPRVCVVHLELDNTKKEYYDHGIYCTALEKYNRMCAQIVKYQDELAEKDNAIIQNKMLRLGAERKRFLGNLKEDAVRRLAAKLQENNRRFLCFCSSIKQAEKLGKSNAFTSKTPKAKKVLDKFNNHEIDSLYVVSKLIEGQNLVDIERGIITQLGGTPRITVQMIGRIMRSKDPIIYIPVFDDTKDDSFLWTLTDNVPADCIKHYSTKSLY